MARKNVRFSTAVLIQQAITVGDVAEMKQLVEQYSSRVIHEPEPSGLPPVMRAVFESQLDSLKFLVEAGADLTVQDQEGWNALHVAAAMDDLEAARYILQRCGGEIARARSCEGKRPADLTESVEMVTLLLEADTARLERTSSLRTEKKHYKAGGDSYTSLSAALRTA